MCLYSQTLGPFYRIICREGQLDTCPIIVMFYPAGLSGFSHSAEAMQGVLLLVFTSHRVLYVY